MDERPAIHRDRQADRALPGWARRRARPSELRPQVAGARAADTTPDGQAQGVLPEPGYPAGPFARLTGLSAEALRTYDRRALFGPQGRDPRTGRRQYGADQLASGRLLAALVGTGMPVRAAAAVVASGDRAAVVEHLAAVRGLVGQAEEHLPLRGAPARAWVEGTALWRLELTAAPAAEELPAAAAAARRVLADHVGCPVDDLPGWESDAVIPAGPAVLLDVDDDGWPRGPEALLLPRAAGASPPRGAREHSREGWWLVGAELGLEGALDPTGEGALVGPGGVLAEVLRSAFRRGLGSPQAPRLLLTDDLGSAAPVVSLL